MVKLADLSIDTLVGTKVAADYLGCSQQTIRNWVKEGKLQVVEVMPGGTLKILVIELIRFKDKMQQSAKIRGR